MSGQPWWDQGDFDHVVDLAYTELFQDGFTFDQLKYDAGHAIRDIIAQTLRNVHFMEIRDDRDGKEEVFNMMMDSRVKVATGETQQLQQRLEDAMSVAKSRYEFLVEMQAERDVARALADQLAAIVRTHPGFFGPESAVYAALKAHQERDWK